MNRLETTFSRARAAKEGVFMPFLVLGDPDPATSLLLAERLINAGADVLEFGFPFSDPPADGPVIQAADQRALRAGMTPPAAFELIAKVRAMTAAPIALLMYYNLILRHGVTAFYRRAKEVGVDAVLVADLPVEEAGPALEAARDAGIAPIFIASELTTPARLSAILGAAKGYLYVVAHIGVTGAKETVAGSLAGTVARLREKTALPLLAGFGISSPEQVRRVLAAGADGAIVGSALIAGIERQLGAGSEMLDAVEGLARAMKAATRAG
jgi:tryptophan synthase alpha chain